MSIFVTCLLVALVMLSIVVEYYLKTMYSELEYLRRENADLKSKLTEGFDD